LSLIDLLTFLEEPQFMMFKKRIQKIISPNRYRALLPISAIILLVVTGCFSIDENIAEEVFGPWIIPSDEVVSLNINPGEISPINNPRFDEPGRIIYVRDERLVMGVRIGDEIKAYPHQVLDWHEVVNDQLSGESIAVTLSPLTGTGIVWNRIIQGEPVNFLSAGFIFRNNSIFTEARTESNWLQMQMRSVNGELSGVNANTYQVVETTWETWKSMYPDSRVLTSQTGVEIDYGGYLFGADYLQPDNSETFTAVKNSDNRLQPKQRLHGIIASETAEESSPVRVYVIDEFEPGVEVITDTFSGRDYIIAGSSGYNFATAFRLLAGESETLQFSAVQDMLPVIMQDNEGNLWDIFGYATEGPRAGERLETANSYTGYWFAWADHFPNLEIFGRD
jgi:hypothetical protein